MNHVESKLEHMTDFYHVVQPIVDLEKKIILGFEFLLRSQEIPNPEQFFRIAKKKNQLNELDKASVYRIFETIIRKKGALDNYHLFINVYPTTLIDEEFRSNLKTIIKNSTINPDSIVFEINESEEIADVDTFKKVVAELKQMGFLISLDDIGKGQANIKNLIEIEPNIAKLDLYFSKDLSTSRKKQDFIHLFRNFLGCHTKMVLEGLELEEDLHAAEKLGVTYGQGYYLGKPQPLEYYLDRKVSFTY